MPDLIGESIRRLDVGGVRLERGLSDEEVSRVQDRFDFAFGPEHRELLQTALPLGGSWPDWRHGRDEDLQRHLAWPVDGVIFDVLNTGFWPASWGPRPDGQNEREGAARAHLDGVPRLVPVYAHRCLTSDPQFEPSPVFSAYQTDVIFYGDNLLDYVAHEFGLPPRHPSQRTHVPFWSDLSVGGWRPPEWCTAPVSVSLRK